MKKITITIITIAIIFATMFNSIDTQAANGTWRYSGGGWWYEYADGSYAHSEYVDGYWLNGAGWYDATWNGSWKHNSTGWWFQSGSWYPTSQWLKIDNTWYYFKSSGYMACNEWIGNYYIQSDGTMATDMWIGDYYVGPDGAWVPGKKKETSNNNNNTNTNTNTNTNQNTNTNNNSNTNSNTTNNNTNNNQINDTATITHTHNWVTTYKTYEPNFTSKFVATDIYINTTHGNKWNGWNQRNYIECNECHTQYNTYADYKANDKCAYHTYVNPTVERDNNGTVKYIYENGILVYNSNDVSIVTIKENYIVDGDGNKYYTFTDYETSGHYNNGGWSPETNKTVGKPVSYGPEVLSVSTVCSGCGATK